MSIVGTFYYAAGRILAKSDESLVICDEKGRGVSIVYDFVNFILCLFLASRQAIFKFYVLLVQFCKNLDATC